MALSQITVANATAGNAILATDHATAFGNLNDLYASRRLAYDERATNYTVDQTSLSSAVDIFSDQTFTANGTSAYRVEFFAPKFAVLGNSEYSLNLTDGGNTSRARAASWYRQEASDQSDVPVYVVFYVTPSAGTVTVNFRLWKNSGTNTTLTCGDGTGTNYAKMWFAVYGPDLT